MRSVRLLFAGVILMSMFIAGCGYTQKTVLPKNIQTIHVKTVQNNIPIGEVYAYQPGLEMDISNAITRRLEQDGNLKVVPEDEADAILESHLIGFNQGGVRFNQLERVEEYRLYVTLAMRLIEAKSGAVIWEEGNFSGDAEYQVTGINAIPREEASRRAVDRLARNVVDRIVEDW